MSKSLLKVAVGCIQCCLASIAVAQNSSLMHAQPAGGRSPTSMATQGAVGQGAFGHGFLGQGSLGQGAPGASTRGPQPPLQLAADQNDRLSPGGEVTQTDYQDRPSIQLNDASWTYQAPLPLRTFRINDVVTIRVDEITRMMAEGSAENRKRTLYEAILTDWIRLQDFRLRPDPQANGDPSVATESNSNYRAESTVESRESMTFNIAATVVDIRPNGNLLLEAKKTIRVNDNLWETSLSGLCRAQDIGPDNVVLSKDVIELEIHKADRGHLRDGYKRGWFQRWFDRLQPF